jgi:4-amino-4-deoxy-L-arabinose transferase-like glycosyltransferase
MSHVRRPSYLADHVIGLLLAVVYVSLLVKTASTLGYARDEGFYFRAAQSYASWFELLAKSPAAAFEQSAVDSAWSNNHEHPALVKSLFALSWTFLYKKLHWFREEGTSFRFGGMCFAGATLWLVHVWGARARSRSVGLVAALLFALMPRVFYHSHLDCFDVPIVFMWTLCAYAYWRSLESGGLGWALATGVVFGLALDTKHNSWFLPFALLLHAVLTRGPTIWRGLRRAEIAVPPALWAMAFLGPLVLFALWPWLWFDTVARFVDYAQFHLHHEYYNMIFLGVNYWKPPMPRGYMWLMTAATVPTITLVLFTIGAVASARQAIAARFRRRSWASPQSPVDPAKTTLLWAIGLSVQLAPWILSSNTPIFGGTKHWLTAYPFLCLFAGVGFLRVSEQLGALLAATPLSRAPGWLGRAALGATVVVAPLVETLHSHPWGLTNYTPLVGGAPGAASLGLNRQFWGFTTGSVTTWLNEHVSPGQSVFIHDTAYDSWEMLHRDGRLAPYVQPNFAVASSTFALYHHEEHMEGVEYQIWATYGTSSPVHIGVYDGVPVIYVYAVPGQVHR